MLASLFTPLSKLSLFFCPLSLSLSLLKEHGRGRKRKRRRERERKVIDSISIKFNQIVNILERDSITDVKTLRERERERRKQEKMGEKGKKEEIEKKE